MIERPVYALSGYGEWFWLMAKNWKDIENRGWPLPMNIRSSLPIRIYLHASKKAVSKDEYKFILENLTDAQKTEFYEADLNGMRGCIIGEITITRQIRRHNENPRAQGSTGGIYSIADNATELKYLRSEVPEYFSKWFFGEFGFVVKDGVLYDKPIQYRGKLGFFKPEISRGDSTIEGR